MGTVYLRGSTWWVGFVGGDGRWHYKSAKTADRVEAERRLSAIEEELRKGNRLAALGPLSVAEWGAKWQEMRLARVPPVWNAKKEWRAVKRYVLSMLVDEKRFGQHVLTDVRPRHALALVRGLRASINRKGKPLAPRSVANIWGTVHKLFEDAVLELDGALAGNPMVLPDVERPQRVDLRPGWRKTAVYSRIEAERLITAVELGADRRMLYALALLGGLRAGEVLDRTWQDYDADAEPLGRLSVHSSYSRANKTSKGTKTEQPREVPVHPRLAAMLAEWKLGGWERAYGRKPEPEDFIILNTRGNRGDDQYILDGLKRDLRLLGMRHRRFHDMRRAFISLALADGANREVLKRVTHGAKGDILDQYTSFDWPALCGAVAKLKLARAPKAVRHG